jgi:hypothetical protein
MLLLGSEVLVDGLLVFNDHLAAGTRHYLPGPPRVVVDEEGRPVLSLIRYRGDRTGGFLTLAVDLSPTSELLDRIRSELATRAGHEVDLVPVLFKEGTVRLTVLGVEQPAPDDPDDAPSEPPEAEAEPGQDQAGPLLVEQVLASTTPSLLGAARAIFSVELDEEAVTLLDAAIRGGDVPVLVVYDLGFNGLRPARGLRARVETAMAYEYLRSRVAARALVFKADLDTEAEALRREGHITIEDVDYLETDPAILVQRQDEVRATLNELAEDLFFRPAASPAVLGADGLARSGAVDAAWALKGRPRAAFQLRDLDQQERQTLTYDFDEAAATMVRASPQGSLRLPPEVDPSSLVLDVTTEGPPEAVEVRAFATAEADWTGIQAIQLDLRAGDRVGSIVLSPDAADGTLLLPAAELGYRVRVMADPEPDALGAPPAPDPTFRPLPSRTLALDPQVVSGRRVVRISLGMVDPAVVRQVDGRLVAGDRSRPFLLNQQDPVVELPVWGLVEARVEGELVTVDGSRVPFGRAVGPDEQAVLVNQPANLFHVVVVTLSDPLDRFESVTVELQGSTGERRTAVTLTPGAPTAQWSRPRLLEGQGTFRYRTLGLGRDARVVETDWQEVAGSLLVVGDVDVRVESVQVVVVGPSDPVALLVTLTSLDPPDTANRAVSTLLDRGQSTFRALIPFRRDAPRRYLVEAQVFLADGELQIGPKEETAEVLLLRLDG